MERRTKLLMAACSSYRLSANFEHTSGPYRNSCDVQTRSDKMMYTQKNIYTYTFYTYVIHISYINAAFRRQFKIQRFVQFSGMVQQKPNCQAAAPVPCFQTFEAAMDLPWTAMVFVGFF